MVQSWDLQEYVCVETGVNSSVFDFIRVGFKGKSFNQEVRYLWKPKHCKFCLNFNHNDGNCGLWKELRRLQVQENPNEISKDEQSQRTDPGPPLQQASPTGNSIIPSKNGFIILHKDSLLEHQRAE